MINVNDVKVEAESLSRAAAEFYSSSDDFNSDSRRAESLLMDYYIQRSDGFLHPALSPFRLQFDATINANLFTLPSDCRFLETVSAVKLTQNPSTGAYSSDETAAVFLPRPAVAASLGSSIRGGSARKNRYSYYLQGGNQYGFIPRGSVPLARLRYVRYPVFAVWGATDDPTNQVQNYDPDISTNYEWNESDRRNLVDILLYLRGLRCEQPELWAWLANQSQAAPRPGSIS